MIRLTASTIERVSACPGSFFAERNIKSIRSAAADQGDKLHKAMAHEIPLDQLTREERRLVILTANLCREVRERVGFGMMGEWHKERYLSLDMVGGTIAGKLDYVEIGENRDEALAVDYKFGYGAVESPETNKQLRTYAVLVKSEWPEVETVHVGIVQPTLDRENRIKLVTYDWEALRMAYEDLSVLVEKVKRGEDAVRTPGEHCRYCKALGTERCPESQSQVAALAQIDVNQIMPTGEALGAMLDCIPAVEAACSALREHARAELMAGHAVPGYRLKPGFRVRRIDDVAAAWEALQDTLTPEAFMGACKVAIGKLEDAVHEAKPELPSKAIGPALNLALGDTLQWEQQTDRLERV